MAHPPKYLFPGGITKADGTPLPPDEPVFLLRAQDELARRALEFYWEQLRAEDLWDAADSVYDHLGEFERWPVKKLPD